MRGGSLAGRRRSSFWVRITVVAVVAISGLGACRRQNQDQSRTRPAATQEPVLEGKLTLTGAVQGNADFERPASASIARDCAELATIGFPPGAKGSDRLAFYIPGPDALGETAISVEMTIGLYEGPGTYETSAFTSGEGRLVIVLGFYTTQERTFVGGESSVVTAEISNDASGSVTFDKLNDNKTGEALAGSIEWECRT